MDFPCSTCYDSTGFKMLFSSSLPVFKPEKIRLVRVLIALVCTLILSSCATQNLTPLKLPPAIVMNKDAGCGEPLFVMVQLNNGEKLPFILDTGSPYTFLDKSFE